MERHNTSDSHFEQEWREAFEGAEMPPSAHLWKGIEAELANNESGYYRKRLLFFKLMAAASVALAMVLSGMWIYTSYSPMGLHEPASTLAEARDTSSSSAAPSQESSASIVDSTADQALRTRISSPTPSNEEAYSGNSSLQARIARPQVVERLRELNNAVQAPVLVEPSSTESLPYYDVQSLVHGQHIAHYDEEYMEPLRPEFAFTPALGEVNLRGVPLVGLGKKRGPKSSENLWAGLNLASGSFDNSISTSGNFAPAFSTMDASSSEPEVSSSTGMAFSAGMGLGKRLGRRFVVLGGFQYGVMQTTTSSNMYLVNASNMERQAMHINASGDDRSTLSFNTTDVPFEYNNRFEMVSIPFQAGYYLISGKLSWMISAGVSSDILLKSIATSTDGTVRSEQRPGDASDWRALNWSGLMGTLVSYQLSERYSLALEPSYRMGLNSLTDTSSQYTSIPNSLMVGFRFNYILQ
jgi:hypothetical protein